MRVFVAGATGAVGRGLVSALIAAGHSVVGLTRTPAKADAIRRSGAEAARYSWLRGWRYDGLEAARRRLVN